MQEHVPSKRSKKNPVTMLILITALGVLVALFIGGAYHNFMLGFGIIILFWLLGLVVFISQRRFIR